jgi:hypothetical protein
MKMNYSELLFRGYIWYINVSLNKKILVSFNPNVERCLRAREGADPRIE